jgi:uncharacterized protein (DUF2384 family)
LQDVIFPVQEKSMNWSKKMKSALQNTMLPHSPYIASDGGINIKGIAKALNMDQSTVVSATGASRQVVSQHFNTRKRSIKLRDKNSIEFWVKLNQMYTLLLGLTDSENSKAEIRTWFNSPNLALDMERPIDLVRQRKLDHIIKKLMDILNAAHGG